MNRKQHINKFLEVDKDIELLGKKRDMKGSNKNVSPGKNTSLRKLKKNVSEKRDWKKNGLNVKRQRKNGLKRLE